MAPGLLTLAGVRVWAIASLCVMLLPGARPAAESLTWTIDPGHSSAQFTVRHMVIANVRGEFDGPTGTVQLDPADPVGSLKVNATIDARTLDTRNKDRDLSLKSANFFDIAKYPTIRFTSKRTEAAGPGRFKLAGDLTMHGVTKEVALDVEGPTPEVKDLDGRRRIGASASTTVDRRDYNLRYNELLEGGGAVVGNEVRIQIEIEVTRK